MGLRVPVGIPGRIASPWLRGVAKHNPDACFVAFEYFVNMQTIIALAGLPNRLVISERNDPARVGSGKKTNWLRERLYRHADMLVCQTDDAAAYFSNKVAKTVILNPVKDNLPEPFRGERRHSVACFCRLEKQEESWHAAPRLRGVLGFSRWLETRGLWRRHGARFARRTRRRTGHCECSFHQPWASGRARCGARCRVVCSAQRLRGTF